MSNARVQIFGGGPVLPIEGFSANVTPSAGSYTILVDATLANRTVTLPPSASNPGRIYIVKRTDSSVNSVTVIPSGADTIDGVGSAVLTSLSAMTLQSDGEGLWSVVSESAGGAPPSSDIFAATRVVSLIPGEGTDLTIAAAVAALPAIGGTIYIKQGTYVISAPIVIPQGKSVIFQGAGSENNTGGVENPSTILSIAGAAGIALFTQTVPGVSIRSTCYFRDFAVRGDGATAQKFIELTGITSTMDVECRNLNISGIRDIINTFVGIEATFIQTKITLPALATSSFWRNTGGGVQGVLYWYGVEALILVATSVAITAAGGAFPNWIVTNSYIGGPSPSTFSLSQILWQVFRIDSADITVASANSKIDECDFITVGISFSGSSNIVGDSIFSGGGSSGYGLLFSGASNVVSNCIFTGGTTRGIDIAAAAVDTVVSGCRFAVYGAEGVRTAATGTVATGNTGLEVTETGAANANRFADVVDASTLIGTTTILNDWNTRSITTTPVTLDETHRTALVDATGGARVVNLPTAASARYRVYTVKKTDASVNTVTIDGSGAETIDGVATVVLTLQWERVTIQSNGTAWFRVD